MSNDNNEDKEVLYTDFKFYPDGIYFTRTRTNDRMYFSKSAMTINYANPFEAAGRPVIQLTFQEADEIFGKNWASRVTEKDFRKPSIFDWTTHVKYRFHGKRGYWDDYCKTLEKAKEKLPELQRWDKTTKIYKVTELWEEVENA